MNAVQVVNRFLEVFGVPTCTQQASARVTDEERLDMMMALLIAPTNTECSVSECVSVQSLKSGKHMIPQDTKVVRGSFARATGHPSEPCYRVFVEEPQTASDTSGQVTFCYDVYRGGTSPGLGAPDKDMILLYRVNNSIITNIYGCVEPLNLCARDNNATATAVVLSDIASSDIWVRFALPIIQRDLTVTTDGLHFNNYLQVETWG